MVSGLYFCFLAVCFAVVSSQVTTTEKEIVDDAPIADRRTSKTFKHFKHKPIFKKHKRYGLWFPSFFGKTQFAGIPVVQDYSAGPYYRFSKPESHSDVHSVSLTSTGNDFSSYSFPHSSHIETYHSDVQLSSPKPIESDFVFPSNDKPGFDSYSSPHPTEHTLSSDVHSFDHVSHFSSHPKIEQIFQPVFSTVATPLSTPAFTFSSVTPAPIFTFVSTTPSTPILPSLPLRVQSYQIPSPPEVIPIGVPKPIIPQFPVSPAPITNFPSAGNFPTSHFLSTDFKISQPSFSTVAPPPSLPVVSLQSFTPVPSPLIPTSLPPVPSVSVTPSPSFAPEAEVHNHHDASVQSYVKDSFIDSAEKTVVPEVQPIGTIESEHIKHPVHSVHPSPSVFLPQRPDHGLLQRLKGWKSDKAHAALSHFQNLRASHKDNAAAFPTVTNKPLQVDVSSTNFQASSFPPVKHPQFYNPTQALPLTPDLKPNQGFLPAGHHLFSQGPQFFPVSNYENFPPNPVQTPNLFNSYGVPLPHDAYALPHQLPHDRVSSAASEEKSSVLPAPPNFTEKAPEKSNVDQFEGSQQASDIVSETQPKIVKQQTVERALPQARPTYVSDANQNVKDDSQSPMKIIDQENISSVEQEQS